MMIQMVSMKQVGNHTIYDYTVSGYKYSILDTGRDDYYLIDNEGDLVVAENDPNEIKRILSLHTDDVKRKLS